MRPIYFWISLAVIWILQIAVGVVLFRARVVQHWDAGDLIVLWTPVLAAFLSQWFILRRSVKAQPGVVLFVATALAVLGFGATMLINLNVYGS
jgi:hypothetical protein